MHWTAALAHRLIPSDAVLVDEWTCIGCGYNLRGARLGGQCPECGLRVEQSIAILSEPERAGAALRTTGLSFLTDLAILLWVIKLIWGWPSALFVGFIILSAGRIYRLVSVWQLRHSCGLDRHEKLQSSLAQFLALCIADTALLFGLFAFQFYALTAGPRAPLIQFIPVLMTLWFITAFASHASMGMLGVRLSQLLDYEALPREFRMQLAWVIATGLFAVLVAAMMVTANIPASLITGSVGLLAALVMLGYTIVTTIHLANAAEQQRHALHDLLEIDSLPQ